MKRLLALTALPLAVVFAAPAQADSMVNRYAAQNGERVCKVLDAYPTFAGIGGIGDAIVNETSFTYRQAGEVIGISVAVVCPWHQDLIMDFARAYAVDPIGAASRRLI